MLLFLLITKIVLSREEEQQDYILVESTPRGKKEEISQIIHFSKEVRELD